MPCTDGRPMLDPYPSNADKYEELAKATQERLDKVTRLLCSLMSELEEMKGSKKLNGYQRVADQLMSNKELQDWWAEHKKHDEDRKNLEDLVKRTAQHKKFQENLSTLQARAIEINRLGGTPTPKLDRQLEVAECDLVDFENTHKRLVKK